MTSLSHIVNATDIFCFDVDSTVSPDEGIDVLAAFAGRQAEVAALTSSAMSGKLDFTDALVQRLALIRPTRRMIQQCLKEHPPRLTAGALDAISALRRKGKRVFLVSGGFQPFVSVIADMLDVPLSDVFANRFVFEDDASDDAPLRLARDGIDLSQPTSRTGGKAAAVSEIKRRFVTSDSRDTAAPPTVTMIGDGVTDMEARPPADFFVGFGGIVARPAVEKGADAYILSFEELAAAAS
jgi:phosphoserine phosphatase